MKPSFLIGTSIFSQPFQWIEQVIESVFSQTYPHWKYLIRIDGEESICQDDMQKLRQLIGNGPENKIDLIIGKSRLGTFGSYKEIFANGFGDYLLQLDADDFLEPTTLDMFANVINNFNDIPLVYAQANVVDWSGKFLHLDARASSRWQKNKDLISFSTFHPRAILRSAYESVGEYNHNLKYTGDYDISLKLCEIKEPIFIELPLYNYRVYPESTSQQRRRPVHDEAISVSRAALKRRGLDSQWKIIHHPLREVVDIVQESKDSYLVAGLHKSGTSIASHFLTFLGVDMGLDRLTPDLDNPKGYGEDIDFVNHQIEWISAHLKDDLNAWHFGGFSTKIQVPPLGKPEWDPIAKGLITNRIKHLNPQSHSWGWKDPRSTLLLEYWKKLIPNLRVLGVYRAPWDACDALARRTIDNYFKVNNMVGLHCWRNYNQRIVDFFQSHPESLVLVNAEAFKQNPLTLKNIIVDRWSMVNHQPSDSSLKDELENLIINKRLAYNFKQDSSICQLYKHAYPAEYSLFQQLENFSDLPSGYQLDNAGPENLFAHNPKDSRIYACISTKDPDRRLLSSIASIIDSCPRKLNLTIICCDHGSTDPESIRILKSLEQLGILIATDNAFYRADSIIQWLINLNTESIKENDLVLISDQCICLSDNFIETAINYLFMNKKFISCIGAIEGIDKGLEFEQIKESQYDQNNLNSCNTSVQIIDFYRLLDYVEISANAEADNNLAIHFDAIKQVLLASKKVENYSGYILL